MIKKFAFTLAEIMIVLTVVGILTAVLVPIALNSGPDENVMKFKKGHELLHNAIRDLIASDKYYMAGDLGAKPDGTTIDGTHTNDYVYFCQTFADTISAKKVSCSSSGGSHAARLLKPTYNSWNYENGSAVTDTILQTVKKELDTCCADSITISGVKDEITTTDGIVFYQGTATAPFGVKDGTKRRFSSPLQETPSYYDASGFDTAYKVFCMDVDGLNNGETAFGYGIRADGKILIGAKAEEWFNKSIKKEKK